MKKIIIMMALAVGLTGFAAQNDKLISFYTNGPDTYADGTTVLDGECYALVWIKAGAKFGGFNQDGSATDVANNAVLRISACAKDGKCGGVAFSVSAEDDAELTGSGSYAVYLMDTRNSAKTAPSAVVGGKVERVNGCGLCPDAKMVASASAPRRVTARLTAAGIAPGTTFAADNVAYADSTVVLDGERVVLVGYPEANAKFHGIDWNFLPVMAGETVQVIGQTAGGRIDVTIPTGLTAGFRYEVAVLDTRVSPTELSAAAVDGTSPSLVCGWGSVAKSETATSVDWTRVWIGNSGLFYHGITDAGQLINPVIFNFDPSENLETGKAAVYGLLGMKDSWFVFDLPKAYVTITNDPQRLRWGAAKGTDEFYCALREKARGPAEGFQLETEYVFKAYSNEVEKSVIHEALLEERRAGQPDVMKKAWKMGFDEVLATFTDADPGVRSGLRAASPEKAEIFRSWYQRNVPFFQWNCDFEISFDRDVEKDSFILAGYYAAAADYSCANPKDPSDYWDFSNWVGSSSYTNLTKGTHFRLLWDNDSASVTVNYQEICERVQEFRCGAYNLSSNNWGTTMTVDLNIYENTGRHTETGSKITVGSYKYTFKGPLNVEFFNADGTPCTAVENISTNHDGRVGFPMPAISTADKTNAFVGWTNANGVVVAATPILVREVSEKNPIKSWYAAEDPLKLYASFKPAQKLTIQTNAGREGEEASNATIKVTKEWIETNVGEDKTTEQVKETLEKKVDNPKSDLTYWQAYLLGIDPKDPNAELKVEQTNGKEEDKALVVSTVQVAAPDAGIKVGYSLDKVEGDEKTVAGDPGKEQATKDLKIDLEPEGDTPTGYYKMNVIFTPTETKEGGETVEGEKVKIPADNTIGVLKVENTDKVVPVAVPWTSLESTDKTENAISVAEIVKTSTLTDKDMMHVYNAERGTYDNWELRDNQWVAVQSFKLDANGHVTKEETTPPESKTIVRGSSVWLERQNPEKPFYLIGQYEKTQPAVSEVKAPETGATRPEYNLIAPTGIEPTDLNEVKALRSDAVGENDKILLFRDGVPFRYTRKEKKWGYWKQVYTYDPATDEVTATSQFVTEDTKVDAGLGLWYISGGGSPRIDWSEKAE